MVSCDRFLRHTHIARPDVGTHFILWWSHFAPARFTLFTIFTLFFHFYAFFVNLHQIRVIDGKIASRIYNLTKKSLNDIKIAISGHFAFKSVIARVPARTHLRNSDLEDILVFVFVFDITEWWRPLQLFSIQNKV